MALAVLAGLLIDGSGGPPVPNGRVIIEGSQVVAAGPEKQVAIPRGAEVIDCSEQTVLPGMIEAHSHIAFCGANRFRRRVLPLEQQVGQPVQRLDALPGLLDLQRARRTEFPHPFERDQVLEGC